MIDDAALGVEPIRNEHRLTGCPGRLLDGAVIGDPLRCWYGDHLSVLVALRLPGLGEHWNAREPAIDIRAGPQLAARHEERVGLRHVGAKIVELHAVIVWA